MLQNIARQIAVRMTTLSKTNSNSSKLNPSPALRATYQNAKQLCSTPRYIIARERENARLLAIKMRELHDKRIARFESFTSLTAACNDKASLQPFKEIFQMFTFLKLQNSSLRYPQLGLLQNGLFQQCKSMLQVSLTFKVFPNTHL